MDFDRRELMAIAASMTGLAGCNERLSSVGEDGSEGAEDIEKEVRNERGPDVHILPPEAEDFGAAVNDKLAEMEVSDVLYVPPVPYDTYTPVETDLREFAIIGGFGGGIGSHTIYPAVRRQTDAPVFRTLDNDQLFKLQGIRIDSGVTGDSPGIVCPDRLIAHNVSVVGIGGDGILLSSSRSDNHNFVTIWQCDGMDLGGSAVKMEESGRETFGAWINLRAAYRCEWAVDIDNPTANGVGIEVQSVVNNSSGCVRLNSGYAHAKVLRSRTTPVGIQFETTGNTGEIVHASHGHRFIDNSGDAGGNKRIDHSQGNRITGALNADSDVTIESGSNVEVPPGAYETIFDVDESTEIITGSLHGANIGCRLTIDGNRVIDDESSGFGENRAGNRFETIPIPPARGNHSMKLEICNLDGRNGFDSGSLDFLEPPPKSVGWKVLRR